MCRECFSGTAPTKHGSGHPEMPSLSLWNYVPYCVGMCFTPNKRGAGKSFTCCRQASEQYVNKQEKKISTLMNSPLDIWNPSAILGKEFVYCVVRGMSILHSSVSVRKNRMMVQVGRCHMAESMKISQSYFFSATVISPCKQGSSLCK